MMSCCVGVLLMSSCGLRVLLVYCSLVQSVLAVMKVLVVLVVVDTVAGITSGVTVVPVGIVSIVLVIPLSCCILRLLLLSL